MKYMRGEESEINHQFVVWYFAKNIKKQLLAPSKKFSCKIKTLDEIDWEFVLVDVWQMQNGF